MHGEGGAAGGEGDEAAAGDLMVRLARVPGGVALSVKDRGAGISTEDQARIFERFYRAESARAKNVRGSGIGLSLVKHIADAHGGRVDVESAPGHGATFTVFVPAAPVAAVEAADEAPLVAQLELPATAGNPSGRGGGA
jgi:signal transduction histidine kinase